MESGDSDPASRIARLIQSSVDPAAVARHAGAKLAGSAVSGAQTVHMAHVVMVFGDAHHLGMQTSNSPHAAPPSAQPLAGLVPKPQPRPPTGKRHTQGPARLIRRVECEHLQMLVVRWLSAHNATRRRRIGADTAWQHFNQAMGVETYVRLPRARYSEAVQWLESQVAVAEFSQTRI